MGGGSKAGGEDIWVVENIWEAILRLAVRKSGEVRILGRLL